MDYRESYDAAYDAERHLEVIADDIRGIDGLESVLELVEDAIEEARTAQRELEPLAAKEDEEEAYAMEMEYRRSV